MVTWKKGCLYMCTAIVPVTVLLISYNLTFKAVIYAYERTQLVQDPISSSRHVYIAHDNVTKAVKPWKHSDIQTKLYMKNNDTKRTKNSYSHHRVLNVHSRQIQTDLQKNNTDYMLEPSTQSNTCVFPMSTGGIGNQMFQFATAYGIAASKNMSLYIPKSYPVVHVFDIDKRFLLKNRNCKTFKTNQESLACGFDNKLANFDGKSSYKIGLYMQSWKYFINSLDALRKQFTFKREIIDKSKNIIDSILLKHNYISRSNVTLIGVHVRRGNMLNHRHGYNVASSVYMEKAVQYYLSKGYGNILFIVCSEDQVWSWENMPTYVDVVLVSGNSAAVDMAILASCDHTISTVGTFGWWSSWLAGGETTYYKWPAKEGSPLRSQFSKDYMDFFYPGWTGLS